MHLAPRLVLALSLASSLSACAATGESAPGSAKDAGRLSVTAGFYPYEFVAARVGGPDVQVTNLTEPGGEPHDLELSPQQVAALSETDLVVYSRGFQPAVDVAVDQQAAGRALDVLTAVDLREGAPGQEVADPHVWLDPVRLATIAKTVADQLAERLPDKAGAFRDRADALGKELRSLDEQLRTGLATCERKQIVTSHDAFGYLAGAYGLEQVSIAGLSPDDEASPKRLAEVAELAREQGVTTIFFEELVSPKVAESLAREVGAQATVLSPLEGAPETGDYVTAMRENLAVLRTALGCT